MQRLLTPLLLMAAFGVALAQPELPRVPRGFDEGRVHLMAEAREGFITSQALIQRLFESADNDELARFLFFHLTPPEKEDLGGRLGIEGFAALRNADAVLDALRDKRPAAVASALGAMVEARHRDLHDATAWLYLRGFNYRVLQSAMNGERIDSIQRRAALRDAKDAKASRHFQLGLWTLNLLDGRDEAGGHYDGVQLVEALLAMGFGVDEFARVTRRESAAAFTPEQRALIGWGDPGLIWPAIRSGLPESELARDTMRYLDANPEIGAWALPVAIRRCETVTRWFRTGGPGVAAVYEGPFPSPEGDPKPPAAIVRELADVEEADFAAHLSDEVRAHFAESGERLLLVVYDDGSARALLNRPARPSVNYGPASPTGNRAVNRQLYEGRVSYRGRNGLLYLVFAGEHKLPPAELDFVNLDRRAGGALLRLDLDDGVNLTSLLLRRTSRLVDAP